MSQGVTYRHEHPRGQVRRHVFCTLYDHHGVLTTHAGPVSKRGLQGSESRGVRGAVRRAGD